MAKLKKQRKRKVYRHNVNRKRMKKRMSSVGSIACKEVKEAWNQNKSIRINLKEMGLSYDPNETIKIPSSKKQLKTKIVSNISEWKEEIIESNSEPPKKYVVEELETDAKAPRIKLFRLPKGQVEWITYLLDKYGTDFKSMAKDKKNYNQETWKQIRAKIKRFQSIPEQYSQYLNKKAISDKPDCINNLDSV